jgi:hypothetical protein
VTDDPWDETIDGPGRIVELTPEEIARVNAAYDRGEWVRADAFTVGVLFIDDDEEGT